jgi:hypothetical protein
MRKIEEGRFCSIHTGHKSKETPWRVHVSLYLHDLFTREKREEQPHLLVGFSPVLSFLGYILCLFVNGVIAFYYSLFSTFFLIS